MTNAVCFIVKTLLYSLKPQSLSFSTAKCVDSHLLVKGIVRKEKIVVCVLTYACFLAS